MSSERPTIADVVKAWFAECSIVRVGDKGTPYSIIPSSKMLESLKILAKTMSESGYSYKEMNDYKVSLKIADTCWREDKIVKMSSSEVKKSKFSLTLDWDIAIAPYSNIKMSKLDEPLKIVETPTKETFKEPVLELVPTDRIKGDSSGMAKREWNNDLLAELASVGTLIDKEDHE